MGKALIKYKIMPEGVIENMEGLKDSIKQKAESLEATVFPLEEQPIAFGLKAIILTISIDETKESTQVEEALKSIPGISSLDVIDYRRALE